MPAVAILIACKDGAGTLGETFDGIAAQDWSGEWEVIFSDNGSSDASVAMFAAFADAHPELSTRLVDASAQAGKSFALNLAVQHSDADAFVLNDADDVMAPGYLAALARALSECDLVGGGNDLRTLNSGWVQSYRGNPPEIRTVQRARFAPFLPFVGGNSMGFTRSLFGKVGGFRSQYEPLEDLDFCFRAQLAGSEIRFLPEATMHHRFRSDPEAIQRQAYAYSKCQVRLAREYRAHGRGQPRPWRQYLRNWPHIATDLARQRLRKPGGPAEEARLAWRLGWQLGQTTGMLAYWSPPSSIRGARRRS